MDSLGAVPDYEDVGMAMDKLKNSKGVGILPEMMKVSNLLRDLWLCLQISLVIGEQELLMF